MNKQKRQDAIHTYKNTSDHLPTLDLTVQEQQWRNDEWRIQRERSLKIKTETMGDANIIPQKNQIKPWL